MHTGSIIYWISQVSRGVCGLKTYDSLHCAGGMLRDLLGELLCGGFRASGVILLTCMGL